MAQIRWKKLAVPLAIASVAAIAVTGVITRILTMPIIYCYIEGSPEVEYGAENCLPSSSGAIEGEGL